MFLIVVIFIVGFVLITKGADIFINCTVEIGRRTNISEIVLGATIVSFATTLPEFTVSVFASLDGHTTMSLGNAVGSIICNTGLALGLVLLLSPFKVDRDMFVHRAVLLILSLVVFLVLGIDGEISRGDSAILLLIFAYYMYSNYKGVKKPNGIKSREMMGRYTRHLKRSENKINEEFCIKDIIRIGSLFIIGLIMMIIGSRLLINSGVKIATFMGIPHAIVSLTVIALGTSLPELVSSITAIRKNHHSISVGNIIGANTLNLLCVIGVSAIPNSLPILSQNRLLDFPFMILLIFILVIPTLLKNKMYRIQGIAMLSTYVIYLGTLYVMYIM
ncbi:calcium/sodium antiporter [Metaclostridioides mangenotii]|uniref:calcium/sodium antiporter n=1 Tax=Metaclostridioides mangenotii TaxID=1540 RepID=UPI0028E77741|nr:calcium/sodium antiporter [Clostridioides mangenotii]